MPGCRWVDEPLARLAVVAGVAALALAIAWAWSRRPRPRSVSYPGLGPGIVLFSSESCAACSTTRRRLDEWAGPDGYRELAWESDADVFERHQVARVPAVAILDAEGSGRLWEGAPPAGPVRRAARGA